METLDDAVGIVLNALEELGLDGNTIIIFTSDNGGVSAGDAFATSNLPLRGGKGYQYEGGILVPYFIKIPWLDNSGITSDVPVTGTDFFPTLLELIGADLMPDEHTDGVSLVPLLGGDSISERPLIWHYPHYGNQGGEPSSIIRLGEWKLIHYYEDGREELYNLERDLGELNNVVSENKDLANQLSHQLFTYLNEVGALFPVKDPLYDKDKEREYLERVVNDYLPALEKQRMDFLYKGFDPGNDWWGSDVNDM